MKYKELQKKEIKELHRILNELREKYQELKFKVASDQLKNVREVREVKRTIAKILFLLSQKQKLTKNSVKNSVKEESK